MAAKLGGFRTPEDAARYYEIYDEFVENHWPVDRKELDLLTDFGPTHVRQSGAGNSPPLFLIHPTAGSSLGWHSIIEPLSRRHTVYTPDTIGTVGRSIQTGPIESPTDLVLWLDQVIDRLELEQLHLVGYSEGGWIAGLHAALTDHPRRIVSLTLIEPAGAIEQVSRRTLANMMIRAARTLAARDKSQAIRDFNHWMSGDIDMSDDEIELVLISFRTFRQHLPRPKRLSEDQLRRITTPTLLLLAEDTRIYNPNEVAERASDTLPNVRIETTPNAGHGLPFQYPEQTTARVLAFIEAGFEER
jgi:pimeloyl-ACP methyl ester carboxylesterase